MTTITSEDMFTVFLVFYFIQFNSFYILHMNLCIICNTKPVSISVQYKDL